MIIKAKKINKLKLSKRTINFREKNLILLGKVKI